MRQLLSRYRQFVTFFLGSGIGVTVDMSIFFTLTQGVRFEPWLANTISAGVGIVTVYLLVTRHSFRVDQNVTSFVLFIGWYTTTIITFSWIIQSLVTVWAFIPILAKITTLPFSFGSNYLFSRFLFARFR
ncbi:MAG: GtrA family protein [Microbacteriaceae bacterium]|nr:GtrA family protein [Microbacteriaceae bacterium]